MKKSLAKKIFFAFLLFAFFATAQNLDFENSSPIPKNEAVFVLDESEKFEDSNIEIQKNDDQIIEPKILDEKQGEDFFLPSNFLPSRSVQILKNQYLDVVYPGRGWTYLGEVGAESKLAFFGKKLGGDDTIFTLRSRSQGKTVLHFYKNDSLSNSFIDDFLEVIIKSEIAPKDSRVTAPSYAEIVPPKPKKSSKIENQLENDAILDSEKSLLQGDDSDNNIEEKNQVEVPKSNETKENQTKNSTQKKSSGKTAIQNRNEEKSEEPKIPILSQEQKNVNTNVDSENFGETQSEDFLKNAKEFFDQKDYEKSLLALKNFLSQTGIENAETLFLLAQILESESSVKNIQGAIECYEKIVKNFPKSEFFRCAKNRITYLKRFYIDIR